MSNQPLVSVVIPTYNSADSLYFAIVSVLKQTYKNFEMIIVDDGSTDNTWSIIKTIKTFQDIYSSDNINIKYYRLFPNSGSPVFPRNYGVKEAEGKYIAFLDADDEWKPNKLELQLWFMQTTGASLSYHDMEVKNNDRKYNWSEMSTCHSGYVFETLLRKNFIPTSSVIILKDHYFGMDQRYKVSHDLELWLEIARFDNIEFLNEILGSLNLHDKSVITANHKRRKETRQIIRFYNNFIPGLYYKKIMIYYYLMEIFDLLPEYFKTSIRKFWYCQKKYRRLKNGKV